MGAARSAAEHKQLVQALQDELLADDLEPPASAAHWSEVRLRQWFEAGGEDASAAVEEYETEMLEMDVQIPRTEGALRGKLLWPQGHARVALCWCSANPGQKFGSEHMDSPVPTALAAACQQAALPLLRFDYSGVRGSGGAHYDHSQPYHPTAAADARDAFAFLRARGCDAIAIGGHSMGASAMLDVAAAGSPCAIVSSGTGPMVGRYMPAPIREHIVAEMCRQIGSLPRGVPKLFVVGDADPMSPREEMEKLISSVAAGPCTLEVVPAARHNFEGCEAEAARRIVRFVLRAAESA